MPTAAFLNSNLTSAVGGIAAAMAVGAFIGQSLPGSLKGTERRRRRDTAAGGFFGIGVMIGLILLFEIRW